MEGKKRHRTARARRGGVSDQAVGISEARRKPMATSDAEFYEPHKFTPDPYEPPRQHGCFFYGCIIASVLALLVMIAVGLLLFVAYRGLGQLVEQYTATAPQELPKVGMPAEE